MGLLNVTSAAEYAVKADGAGHFTPIQTCADTAKVGDSCLVYPGTYNERVSTKFGRTSSNPDPGKPLEGTYPSFSSSNRTCSGQQIPFKAVGEVTLTQFFIRHPFITVDKFRRFTNYITESTAWDG